MWRGNVPKTQRTSQDDAAPRIARRALKQPCPNIVSKSWRWGPRLHDSTSVPVGFGTWHLPLALSRDYAWNAITELRQLGVEHEQVHKYTRSRAGCCDAFCIRAANQGQVRDDEGLRASLECSPPIGLLRPRPRSTRSSQPSRFPVSSYRSSPLILGTLTHDKAISNRTTSKERVIRPLQTLCYLRYL